MPSLPRSLTVCAQRYPRLPERQWRSRSHAEVEVEAEVSNCWRSALTRVKSCGLEGQWTSCIVHCSKCRSGHGHEMTTRTLTGTKDAWMSRWRRDQSTFKGRLDTQRRPRVFQDQLSEAKDIEEYTLSSSDFVVRVYFVHGRASKSLPGSSSEVEDICSVRVVCKKHLWLQAPPRVRAFEGIEDAQAQTPSKGT